MRRCFLLIGGALLLFTNVTPAAADQNPAGPYNVRVSPAAGPPNTEITVTGTCVTSGEPTTVTASIDTRNGSHSTARSTTQQSDFTLRLPVPPVDTDPVDLEVTVECHGITVPTPFTITRRTTTSEPTLLTGIQPATCDHTCLPRAKGFAADGAQSSVVNFFDGGGSLAIGTISGIGTVVASGTGPGSPARFAVRSAGDQRFLQEAAPFGSFFGGVSVAFGDVDGDRSDELIVGAGPGGGPHVKVFRYNPNNFWEEMLGFFAYAPRMGAGVSVAAADLDRDGRDEIITGPGAGGGPHVRVFRANGTPLGDGFFAYDPRYLGGVNVAAGDVAEGSAPEIVTGTGPGGGSHVRVFRANGEPLGNGFFAYDPAYNGGVSVSVGQVSRFGRNSIVTAPLTYAAPHVRVFTSPDGAPDGPGFYAFSIAPSRTLVAALPR